MNRNSLKTIVNLKQASSFTKIMVIGNGIIALWSCHRSNSGMRDSPSTSASSSFSIKVESSENSESEEEQLSYTYKLLLSSIITNTQGTIDILDTIATSFQNRDKTYQYNWKPVITKAAVGLLVGGMVGGILYAGEYFSEWPWGTFAKLGVENGYLDLLCVPPTQYLDKRWWDSWKEDSSRLTSCPTYCLNPRIHDLSLLTDGYERNCIVNGTNVQVKHFFPMERLGELIDICVDSWHLFKGPPDLLNYQAKDLKALYRCDEAIKKQQEAIMGSLSPWMRFAKGVEFVLLPITGLGISALYETVKQHRLCHQLLTKFREDFNRFNQKATKARATLNPKGNYSNLVALGCLHKLIEDTNLTFNNFLTNLRTLEPKGNNQQMTNLARQINEQIAQWENGLNNTPQKKQHWAYIQPQLRLDQIGGQVHAEYKKPNKKNKSSEEIIENENLRTQMTNIYTAVTNLRATLNSIQNDFTAILQRRNQ